MSHVNPNSVTGNAQADVPAAPHGRRPVSGGGAAVHAEGSRRLSGNAPLSPAQRILSVIYLSRCCALTEDQHRLLVGAYSNLSSLPAINDTQCLRNMPRCVIYAKERVECLRLRSRYGVNVLSLLEPRESFTLYSRTLGPGKVLCKNSGFSWMIALVVGLSDVLLLANYCYCTFVIIYIVTIWRMPSRPELDPVRRGGVSGGAAAALTTVDNARTTLT
ncbi:hypothetical protein HPB50_012150 [Hyalomma asiaticum]|uniref:Uncharacterized protein n=1 Tax=Hyalomma asiaticum TaxID=266040 RepID=A0ACB7SDS9_HYAAI|nr:hypothetical protein HPB50_012150 [Hyalomma asiaticum]